MSDEEASGGVPAWVLTFADLMSLLLCFFVLLLSFAEMDIVKYKQVAGSMKMAFGVQKATPSEQSDLTTEYLEGRSAEAPEFDITGKPDTNSPEMIEILDALKAAEAKEKEQALRNAMTKLSAALEEDIDKGMVKINAANNNIIINISEKASFQSGDSAIRPSFAPALKKLQTALTQVEGQIVVAGHTDNRPIRTSKFRSNWELSASRAVTVVHELVKGKVLPVERFLVEGHADAHPVAPNDNRENRAKNRRVVLTIVRKNETLTSAELLEKISEDGDSDDPAESSESPKNAPNDE